MATPAGPPPPRGSSWLAGSVALAGGSLLLAASTAILENCAMGYESACAVPPHPLGWTLGAVAGLVAIAIGAFFLGRVSVVPLPISPSVAAPGADPARSGAGDE